MLRPLWVVLRAVLASAWFVIDGTEHRTAPVDSAGIAADLCEFLQRRLQPDRDVQRVFLRLPATINTRAKATACLRPLGLLTSGLKTRLRLFGRVFPIFVRIVGRGLQARHRPIAACGPPRRQKPTSGACREHSWPPGLGDCSENRRAASAPAIPGRPGLGLQYEFTRPAVAGAVTPGSDRLGRKARAAETPKSHSLNKTTRTL